MRRFMVLALSNLASTLVLPLIGAAGMSIVILTDALRQRKMRGLGHKPRRNASQRR